MSGWNGDVVLTSDWLREFAARAESIGAERALRTLAQSLEGPRRHSCYKTYCVDCRQQEIADEARRRADGAASGKEFFGLARVRTYTDAELNDVLNAYPPTRRSTS